ncbi:MAG: ABC transporter permease [Nitrososphaerota archaeon]
MRLERRLELPRRTSAAVSALLILLSFVVASAIFEVLGVNSVSTLSTIASVFLSPTSLLQAVLRGLPIGMAALGLSIAFRMNFWNIGAEGQLYMGMFAATGMVLLHAYYGAIPEQLLFLSMLVTSFISGGLYCALPGFLRARLGVNEILPTLMLNYVAILFVDFLVYGPWRDPRGFSFPLSIVFPGYARMETFMGNASYFGLILAIVAAALVYGFMQKTTLGFEMRVVGQNIEAARYGGINLTKTTLLGSFLAGGLAGIGGLIIVSGLIGRLRPRASPGYGYTAIIVAFLAGLNPWLIVPASIFFGGLLVAGEAIQAALNLPVAAVQVFQAIIFIMIIVAEFFKRYRVTLIR